jgi:membrane-associated phospholipid phosphatase
MLAFFRLYEFLTSTLETAVKGTDGTASIDQTIMPSRHTAVAWAVATPFAEEYKAPWLYGVAAITNLARIGKQEHWVSDTVAGSLLGYGIGKLFLESSRANSQLPQVMIDPSGVTMSWTYY